MVSNGSLAMAGILVALVAYLFGPKIVAAVSFLAGSAHELADSYNKVYDESTEEEHEHSS